MTSEPTRGRAGVVVVSTQASTDRTLDRTGPVIAAWLRERGFTVAEPTIVPDGGPSPRPSPSSCSRTRRSSSPRAAPASRRPTAPPRPSLR